MFQYQLRLPQSMVLIDLVREVALNSWNIFHQFSQRGLGEGGTYLKFRKEIFNAFSPYLKGFALCGSSGICEDEMRPLDSEFVNDLEVKIYQLQLPLRLEPFLDHLASMTLKKLRPTLKDSDRRRMRDALQIAFRSALQPYLCSNPWCGKAQICGYSQPVNVWNNETPKE